MQKQQDMYHHYLLKGIKSDELIEKVTKGNWNPEFDDNEKKQKMHLLLKVMQMLLMKLK